MYLKTEWSSLSPKTMRSESADVSRMTIRESGDKGKPNVYVFPGRLFPLNDLLSHPHGPSINLRREASRRCPPQNKEMIFIQAVHHLRGLSLNLI